VQKKSGHSRTALAQGVKTGRCTGSVPQNAPNSAAYTHKPVCRAKGDGHGKLLNKQDIDFLVFVRSIPALPRQFLK
jgi:hypothetical protein